MLQKLLGSISHLRLLVFACQASGIFPFTWSSPQDGPGSLQFSVPLFLWSFAIQVAQLAQIRLVPLNFRSFSFETVGSLAIGISLSTLYFGSCINYLISLCKSSSLADLLSTLTYEDHYKRNSSRKISLGQMAFATITLACCIFIVVRMTSLRGTVGAVMYFITLTIVLKNVVMVLLYGEILMILADKLEWNSRKCTEEMPLNSCSGVIVVLPKQTMEQQLNLLQRLERQIRQVIRIYCCSTIISHIYL